MANSQISATGGTKKKGDKNRARVSIEYCLEAGEISFCFRNREGNWCHVLPLEGMGY